MELGYIPGAADGLLECTGLRNRRVRITRRSREKVEVAYRHRQRIASVIEQLSLLRASRLQQQQQQKSISKERDKQKARVYEVANVVESNIYDPTDYIPCKIVRVNDNGTYDIEFIDHYKSLYPKFGVDADALRSTQESTDAEAGEASQGPFWHWDGISDSDDDDWNVAEGVNIPSPDRDQAATLATSAVSYPDEEFTQGFMSLTFEMFNELGQVLAAAGGDVSTCVDALGRITGGPFSSVQQLAMAVKDVLASARQPAEGITETLLKETALLNLLYAPRGSFLQSVLTVLSRLDDAGYILAWSSSMFKAEVSLWSLAHLVFARLLLTKTQY